MRHIEKKSWRMQQVEQSLGEPLEEVLRRKYVDENKSLYVIAEELGISYRIVLDWLKQAGIYSRNLRN